jgi:hypothetical protein
MQIGVTAAQLPGLLSAVPVVWNNALLYALDETGANVVAFAAVTYATDSLVVTISDALTFAAFELLVPDRDLVQVSSLTA